jgi:hypothetical protein
VTAYGIAAGLDLAGVRFSPTGVDLRRHVDGADLVEGRVIVVDVGLQAQIRAKT